jgi:hypothetical protein
LHWLQGLGEIKYGPLLPLPPLLLLLLLLLHD